MCRVDRRPMLGPNARGLARATLLLVPCAAFAQSFVIPVPTPKNIILPNYDNSLVGLAEAVEGGAYLARTQDASASFYNPAGLAAADTSFSASASGFVLSQLRSQTLGQSTSHSRIETSPGYFAVVVGTPLFKTDGVRLGFGVTNAVSWSPSGIDEVLEAPPASGRRLTYSSKVGFSTLIPTLSVGFKLTPTVRLGAGVGLAHTEYSDTETFSGELPISGSPARFVSVLRASDDVYHVALSAGVQWDAARQITVGAVVRAPGLRLTSGSLVTYESITEVPGLTTTASFRDDSGAFQYKLPLELSAGVAYRGRSFQAEIDVRYHASAGQYTFYRSARPMQVTTQNPDASISQSTQPFADVVYSTRAVANVAAGASYHRGKALAFHAGFFTSFSPIGNAALTPFQRADLYGATVGAELLGEHWSGSLGLAFELGSSTAVETSGATQLATTLDYRSVTVLYAVAYKF